MFPGQLRPSFATHDREKRYAMTGIAWLAGAGFFLNIMDPAGGWPFLLAVVTVIVGMQLVYAQRMRVIRRVRSDLARESPADRWFVGNVRLVGPGDSGPDDAPFRTAVIQVSARTLSLWNPDEPSHQFLAFPLRALDLQVDGSRIPRWRLTVPFSPGETYIALFEETGFGLATAKRLEELSGELLRQRDASGSPL